MGVERRRAGFRLPWAGEGEEAEGEQTEADVEVDELTPSNGSAVPASDESTTDAPTADAATPAESGSSEPMTQDSDSAEFLANLVGAMRGVAETSRDASLGELRAAVDQRIETLGTQGAERETELRRQADVDLEAVGAWERSEIDRVRTEAEEKRDKRRRELERQLTERGTATDREIEATRSRMAEHERDLAAFFAQLGEITDPAAFVAAAKRMPHAPELDDTSAPAAAVSSDDPRLAALGMSATTDTVVTETEAIATATEAVAPATEVEPVVTEPAIAEPAAAEGVAEPAPDTNPQDAQLAERLAQLDERLSGATQPVTAAAPTSPATNGGETSTAIVVKGLGSFGAITSFKQALERVEGVRGVTLSLGPTGEFVYRASHAGDFDLTAAIQSIEGPTATIEETDGTLVVTLSRTR